jgi:hypothetical protein
VNITVVNGLILAGRHISLRQAMVDFQGTQTLGGTGRVTFESSEMGRSSFTVHGGVLSIERGVLIEHAGNIWSPDGGIINFGTILVDGPGTYTSIEGKTFFENRGTIHVSGGANLRLGGRPPGGALSLVSNTGTIEVDQSTLVLDGEITTVGIGTITRTGGTVALSGKVINDGATFPPAGLPGPVNLTGTIKGGTVRFGPDSGLTWSIGGFTLDSVEVAGILDLIGTTVRIVGGIRVAGTITLHDSTWQSASLQSVGDMSIDGPGSIVINRGYISASGGRLILGSGLTIRCMAANSANTISGTGGVVNHGTILIEGDANLAAQTGGAIHGAVTNTGKLVVVAGRLNTLGDAFENSGDVDVHANAQLFTRGPYSQTGGMTRLLGGEIDPGGVDGLSDYPFDLQAGVLEGTGWVRGNLISSGRLSPGGISAVGTISVAGNLSLLPTSILDIEIGGRIDASYDRLRVTGMMTIAGIR